MEKPEPRNFSFNAPFGMCPDCNGIGYHQTIDPDLVIPNKDISIKEGALSNFVSSDDSTYYSVIVRELAKKYDFPLDIPLKEASDEFMNALLYGDKGKIKIGFNSHFGGYKEREVEFEGIINNIQRRYFESNSEYIKAKFAKFL